MLVSFFSIDQKESVRKLFQSFESAWDLVRHLLSSQGINDAFSYDIINVSLRKEFYESLNAISYESSYSSQGSLLPSVRSSSLAP